MKSNLPTFHEALAQMATSGDDTHVEGGEPRGQHRCAREKARSEPASEKATAARCHRGYPPSARVPFRNSHLR